MLKIFAVLPNATIIVLDYKNIGEFLDVHICFINTPPNAMYMNLWRESIKEKIYTLTPQTPVGRDFIGNCFIDAYSKNFPQSHHLADVDEDMLLLNNLQNTASHAGRFFLAKTAD